MSRKEKSREAILWAAEQVVMQAGAAHLTLEAVAEKAGVSKGGLLYHFPSKEALLQEMVAHLLGQCDAEKEKFKVRLKKKPTADLEAHIRTAFRDEPAQKQIAVALLAAGANNPKLLAPVRAWQNRNYRELVKTKRNPRRAAVILSALDGFWFNDVLQISPLSVRERKQLMQELIELARSAV